MSVDIINLADFKKHLLSLSLFPSNTKVAVAVSGGSDSLCLIFLLQKLASELQLDVCALIVDHKLRPDSTTESQNVAEYLTKMGIKNILLKRTELLLSSKIQEIARKDRYKLLYSYCESKDYSHLLVAHHADDVLETMLMRSAKGKNIVGKAGISAKLIHEQVILLRPLLKYTKQQLINTLQLYTNKWVEDPSNVNDKFTRVQIRKQLQTITEVKKKEYIAQLAKAVRDRKKIENTLINLFVYNLVISNLGVAKLNLESLLSQEVDIQIMYLRKLMQLISGSYYMVKINKTYNLLNFLTGKQHTYTLGGCMFKKKQTNQEYINLYIAKEVTKHNHLLHEGLLKRWDNRFIINFKFNQNSNKLKDYKVDNISLGVYQDLVKNVDFKIFMKDNFVTFNELSGVPCIFYKNKQQSWLDKKYQGILLEFSQSLFMNKFI